MQEEDIGNSFNENLVLADDLHYISGSNTIIFHMKTHNILLLVLLLVLVDQGAKLIIYTSYMDTNFEIIPKVLDFKPAFNSKYSFFNDSVYKNAGVDAGLLFHIFLFAIVWFVLFIIYRFFKRIEPLNKMLDASICFLTAGVICAYLGMLVWENGILDFLHFKLLGNIIFDLKDIYLNCFVILLIVSTKRIEKTYNIKSVDFRNYLQGLFQKRE